MKPDDKHIVLQALAALTAVLASPGIMLWESDERRLKEALQVLREYAR